MNPLLLFLFCFLAVSFYLILIQQELTKWQKFSLVLNPALLALVVLFCMEKTANDRAFAADVAPIVNVSADLLQEPGSENAKKAARRIREFINNPDDKNWKKLSDDLKKLVQEEKTPEKS